MTHLSFTNFIIRNNSLTGAFKPTNIRISFMQMFLTNPTVDSFTPKLET